MLAQFQLKRFVEVFVNHHFRFLLRYFSTLGLLDRNRSFAHCCVISSWFVLWNRGQRRRTHVILVVPLLLNLTYHGHSLSLRQWIRDPSCLIPERVKARFLVEIYAKVPGKNASLQGVLVRALCDSDGYPMGWGAEICHSHLRQLLLIVYLLCRLIFLAL